MIFRGTFTVALLCVAGAAHAGDKPLYEAAPGWIVPAPAFDAAKLTDADPALIVMDQQQRVGDGQVWEYTDQATRVISGQTLRDLGTVTIPWQPDAGDLIVHRAEIIRGGEHIDLVAAGQRFQVLRREEQLAQWQLNGTLTATLAVEGLRVGDVLRLSYSITSKDKALQGNVQTAIPLIAAPGRAKFARARLSWPASTPLKWRGYADGLAPKVATRGGFDEIEIALPLAKPAELPGDAPMRFQKLSILEATSFADWRAVSKVMAPLYQTDGLIPAGSPLAGEVAKIAAKSSDPRTRAALALRLVQDETRYLFKGMDGGNYTPQKPADTWSLRYGDCKAKTLLLLAILHGLGIEAEPVVASIEMGDLVAQRLPSPGAFDHVIVRALIEGKSLWLDGTGSGNRLADIDDTPPFRTVLPLRSDGAELMPIVMHAAARPMAEITAEFDQSAGLSLPTPFTVTFLARGATAEMIHTGTTQADKEQLSGMVQMMVANTVGEALIGERAVTYDAESATATIVAKGILSTPWAKTDDRYRAVLDKTVSKLNFAPDRARAAWKDIPVVTSPVPLSTIYRVRIRLPDKGAGFELEGDRSFPGRFAGANVTRSAKLDGEWLSLEDEVSLDGAEIAAADVAATRAQVSLAQNRLATLVAPAGYPPRWKVVAEARRSGAFAPILAAYAKAIEDDPKETLGYTNRANFFSGVWDWKGALADLDKAISIEPSASLYFWRARTRVMLRDDKGAIADVQSGLALEPGSTEGLNQLATLRFRAGQREEALASISERIDQGGSEKVSFVIQKGELLAEAGRGDEAIATLDAAIKVNPGNANLLNERCWVKGTLNTALDTALKDCTKGIELAENPASIYDSRALVYFRMGRMDDALTDLNAALDLSPGQGASLYMRGVIRKQQGDAKGSTDDLAAARLMSARIDEDYARYGIKP
ncbi:DUF3857 domain-containing protein [Sphingomonas sp. MMS12-HWE2-04]|uniref:DUF3857 domain-containing protein n=1 Tax=Sphingomonas sp. MMS12-HWE2-04 TaxID=3234199 RepID=UPI00384D6470